MKIGIYGGYGLSNPTSGGGHTFEQSLLKELEIFSTHHEFFIFHHGHEHVTKNNVHYIPLSTHASKPGDGVIIKTLNKSLRWFERRTIAKEYKSAFNKALFDHHIDLAWFVTPGYVTCDQPFLYTVWDLQHRRQSFFPEVSVTGSTFEDREKHYAAVLPKAATVIVSNQTAKQEVIRFYGLPDERVATLTLPTPSWVFSHAPDVIHRSTEIQSPYLFYPAQFWPHKNHVVLLHALKKLRDRGENFNLVFTGSDKGNATYLKLVVQDLGLHNSVHFRGFVERAELRALYSNAYALVFPSFFGPDNIPPLEAAALGCPVIMADVAGTQEQMYGAALFFDPRNENELIRCIDKLQEPGVRQYLISKGVARATSWTTREYLASIIIIIDSFEPIRRCWSSANRYIHL